MDIKKILLDNGVDVDKVETIKDSINKEIGQEFVTKVQYRKKIESLDDITNKYNDLEAKYNLKDEDTNNFKNKYEQLQEEFNNYKNNLELQKTKDSKVNKLKEKLKSEKFNNDIIDLLTKEFNLDELEIENDDLKNWDTLVEPIKNKYSNFIVEEKIKGSKPAQTPTGVQKSFTREDIESMSTKDINDNWEAISKSLELTK